jgi:hypothetical protein
MQHPLSPQGESIERSLVYGVGVFPMGEVREGGLHTRERVVNFMVCQ